MKRLRALMVEDRPEDTELLVRELRRGGYELEYERLYGDEPMREALARRPWDIVFSDYSMPGFTALDALEVLKQSGLELPFIIVSGTIGEETAVGALKAGANDFLVKGQLARLLPAVERELRESAARTARRQAEAALRQSEERFRTLIDRLPDLVIVARERRIVFMNPAAVRALGHATAHELIGYEIEALVHPADRAELERRLAMLERGRAAGTTEQRWRRSDGSYITVEIASHPLTFDGLPSILATAHDITEQKNAQTQLLVSDRMASVGTLAAGVAHEINNPLAVVLANLEYLGGALDAESRRIDAVPEDAGECLVDALDAARRVREIVRDLKMFSRAEDPAARIPVRLEQVFESTLRMAWNEIRHRARLLRDYGADVPEVLANEGRLGQVILNLVVNAAQAIPPGHTSENEIRVSTGRAPDGWVLAEVQDTGPGIPKEAMHRLFTPFYTTKPVGVGTGLGLSICHRIITEFGGQISVESEVGKGTTFRIRLPPAPAEREHAAVEAPAVVVARGIGPRGRILVVDDEVLVGKAVHRALRNEHDVEVLGSASMALERLVRGARYDVILCDLMMPEMTGMELHAALSQRVPEQAEAMVFLTGGAFTAEARAFLEERPERRLDKPFDIEALGHFIAGLLRANPG